MGDFPELKDILVIIHLFGVVMGAGGAFMSDAMFFSTLKDLKISKTEMRFLRIGSTMVWLGLITLFVSGYFLYRLDPVFYLNSHKFLAKMTLVAIILINGIFLHVSLIPLFGRHVGEHLPSSDELTRKRPILFTSGAISFTSWVGALILGALRSLPVTYWAIMGTYFAVLFVTAALANLLGLRLIPRHRHREPG